MKHLIPVILVLFLALQSCGLPPASPTAPATAPATSAPNPTASAQDCLLPSGFAVAPDNTSILFYSPNGSVTGNLVSSDPGSIDLWSLIATGGTSAGIPSMIYFSYRVGSKMIQNTAGLETVLVSSSIHDLFWMAGAACTPFFTYSTAADANTGLVTRLYVGTAATIGVGAPVVDITSADNQAIKPLALDMAGGVPIGVWYTGLKYATGDTLFDPCSRLVYVDLHTGVSSELLGNDYYFPGLSPDHTWVAYARNGFRMPLSIRNLVTGANFTFPVWPANEWGSGDGVFSPDNTYVAWMEASGDIMANDPPFQTIVRVGTTNGQLFRDYPMQDFDTAAGFQVGRAGPVAWLDNDSVLIQVSGLQNVAVLRLDLPSTLVYLASGKFVGLTYP